MQKVQVYGVEDTIRKLQMFQPELIKESRKDLRIAAEPIASSIRDYIPNEPPLLGMRHNGRTSWQPNNVRVTVRTDFSKRAFKREESLVKIVVGGKKGSIGAAGLQIADMAGRRNKVRSSGSTRQYVKNGRTMSHRLNNQGRSMIEYLTGKYATPSRFVWRAASLHVPRVQASVMQTIDKLMKETNQRLMVKD